MCRRRRSRAKERAQSVVVGSDMRELVRTDTDFRLSPSGFLSLSMHHKAHGKLFSFFFKFSTSHRGFFFILYTQAHAHTNITERGASVTLRLAE